jgi:hypothetical protein
VKSESEAVAKLITSHILPNCSQLNCQVFRDTRYWNEECDNIFKAHMPLFEHIYNTHSGSRALPGEKSYFPF